MQEFMGFLNQPSKQVYNSVEIFSREETLSATFQKRYKKTTADLLPFYRSMNEELHAVIQCLFVLRLRCLLFAVVCVIYFHVVGVVSMENGQGVFQLLMISLVQWAVLSLVQNQVLASFEVTNFMDLNCSMIRQLLLDEKYTNLLQIKKMYALQLAQDRSGCNLWDKRFDFVEEELQSTLRCWREIGKKVQSQMFFVELVVLGPFILFFASLVLQRSQQGFAGMQ